MLLQKWFDPIVYCTAEWNAQKTLNKADEKGPSFLRTILPQSREGHVTCQDVRKLEYGIKVYVDEDM